MDRFSRFAKIAFVILVILAVALVYFMLHRNEESTDDATIDGHVVTISPKVAGYVTALNIDDNQVVKAGDVLLEIDPRDYIIRRDHARAALLAAQAGYSASGKALETTRISAPSDLDAAKTQVEAAQANWIKAANDLRRMQHLSNQARSREQLDSAIAAEKTARSQLEDTKAKLRSAETAPKVIASAVSNAEAQEAQVKEAEANLAQAEKDLADTKILSPIDGRITNRSVERGDYVEAGQQLSGLVGKDIWVTANFKETQIQHMHIGDKADIRVDAFPDVKIEGKIDSFQAGTGGRFSAFPPENATGNYIKIVQRVPVKIILTKQPETPVPLGPGMSVIPTVYTK